MNDTILLITGFASLLLIALGLLIGACVLLRKDLERLHARGFSPAQLTRDPLALKDALVQFFAASKGASRIIRLLAARRLPLAYQAFVEEVRFDEHWRRDSDPLPAGAILALLAVMQVVGLARFGRHGLSITAVGRHVHGLMDSAPQAPFPHSHREHSQSEIDLLHGATLSSADRVRPGTVRRKNAPVSSHQ